MSLRARALIPNASNTAPARPDRPSGRALILPIACALSLLAFAACPPVQHNPHLLWSFLGTGVCLLALAMVLLALAASRRGFSFYIELRPQHDSQAFVHASYFLHWVW